MFINIQTVLIAGFGVRSRSACVTDKKGGPKLPKIDPQLLPRCKRAQQLIPYTLLFTELPQPQISYLCSHIVYRANIHTFGDIVTCGFSVM